MSNSISTGRLNHNKNGMMNRVRGKTASCIIKRVYELCLSIVIVVLLLPLMLIISLAIQLDSKGPTFFLQRRTGYAGNCFMIYKFRTMKHSSDSQAQASVEDPRVTRVGRLLRRSSLDELPQIINVLKGDMSFVGPRPHPVWLDAHFEPLIANYSERYAVKPGITGLAQINDCRGETPAVRNMEARIHYDLNYIKSWSLTMDAKIILITCYQLIFKRNAY